MRWPIRRQILVPFATILLLAVACITAAASVLAARRSGEERVRQLRGVVETLEYANFPYTENVLKKMRGLSGAHFIAVDHQGRTTVSTFPEYVEFEALLPEIRSSRPLDELSKFPSIVFAGNHYFAAAILGPRSAEHPTLYVLYPELAWQQARWDASWPPLAVGAVTALVMVLVSAWVARRLGRRVQSVQELFARLADGKFDHAPAAPPYDEIFELVVSANRLSDQLALLRDQISRTERLRLLAHLAGGLAHQLRNAVTGARLAVQLHQRRCVLSGDDESLAIALQQLSLTEEQIKGMLSLGREHPPKSDGASLPQVIDEIRRLVSPLCKHSKVDLQIVLSERVAGAWLDGASDVKAGLLNMVLNAIEAAGNGVAENEGQVSIDCETLPATRVSEAGAQEDVQIRVSDTGAGPPAGLDATLFEPFVTSKPEGVGLGLPLARMAALNRGGSLSWRREAGRTIFTMVIPLSPPPNTRAAIGTSAGTADAMRQPAGSADILAAAAEI